MARIDVERDERHKFSKKQFDNWYCSVIAVSILHGSYNGTAGLSLLIISYGNDLLMGLLGVAGLLGVMTINLALLYYDKYHEIEKGKMKILKITIKKDWNVTETLARNIIILLKYKHAQQHL